jgi:hypothetical protein
MIGRSSTDAASIDFALAHEVSCRRDMAASRSGAAQAAWHAGKKHDITQGLVINTPRPMRAAVDLELMKSSLLVTSFWLTLCATASAQPSAPPAPPSAAPAPPTPATPRPAPSAARSSRSAASTPPPSAADPSAPQPSAAPPSAPPPPSPATSSLENEFSLLGCHPTSLLELHHTHYAACGSAIWIGVLGNDGGLHVVEAREAGATVRSLFVRDDTVWVEQVDQVALPLARLSVLQPAAADAPSRTGIDPALIGHVVEVHDDQVTIDLGKQHGLQVNDHIELYETSRPDGDVDLDAPTEHHVVARVSAIANERARATLGMNEVAKVGMAAHYAEAALTANSTSPPRTPGLLVLEAGLRPFLPIERVGVGVLSELAITYFANIPLYVRAELRPFGGRAGSGRDSGVFGSFGEVGYDHTYLGIGVGAGALYYQKDFDVAAGQRRDDKLALGALLHVRIGSGDGVNAQLTTAFALRDQRWDFGFFDLTGQTPLGGRTWLTGGIGGGPGAGFLYAEIGLRLLISGNGQAGSIFIRPSVGLAGIDRRLSNDSDDLGVGPMVGLHIESRLGL